MPSPLGRNARPQGTSLSVATVVTAPTPPPPPALVLAVAVLLGLETLPARSCARTWKVYVVLAFRFPTLAVRVLASVEATGVFPPFWKTSYPPSPIPPPFSVEAFQTSVIVLAVCAVLCRPVGALGGVWSLDGLVVATASLLSCEELPAASRATIVKTYWVPGISLVTVALSVVPLTFSMNWPCLKTSYSATPTLSVDLFHASETVVSVTPVTWVFVGGEGGRVSAARAGLALATSPTPSAASAPATINFRRSLGTTELLLRSTGTGGVAATDVLALAKDGRAGLPATENVCYR